MLKSQRFRGKSIKQILKLKNVPTLSANRINNVMTKISSFFNWAEQLA